MRPYGSPKQLEKRRLKAMELLNEGFKPSEVVKKVQCSPSSLHSWRKTYLKEGEAGLKPIPAAGRPSRLKPSELKRLTQLLLKGPLAAGYPTDLWTSRRVVELIRKHFKVQYHPNHLWRLFKKLGWSYQKPEKRALERNEKAIEHWKRYKWPAIKKSPKTWSPPDLSG